MYFHADDKGDPDLSRPLTQLEHVEAYWANVDNDPHSLADLYLNFHDFDRIEFILFKDRLSAAILVARSAGNATSRLRARLEQQRQDGSHRVPGWEGESDDALESSLGVVQDAQEIAIGATRCLSRRSGTHHRDGLKGPEASELLRAHPHGIILGSTGQRRNVHVGGHGRHVIHRC